MNDAPTDKQGESSGVLITARVVGQSLSVVLAGAIFALAPGRDGRLPTGRSSAAWPA
jgi:hypothetical protein